MKRSWLNKSERKNLMRAILLGTFAAGSVVVACSSDSPAGIGGGTHVEGEGGVIACTEGSTTSCYVTIGMNNGVLSCYEGTRTCTGGVWTECAGGKVTSKMWEGSLGSGALMKPLAVTASSDCDNPCDPTCQNMDGDPDVISEPDVIENWIVDYVGGSVAGLPTGLVYGKGIIEPCEWGGDCQFNHACTNVATNSACPHSKCTTGVGFEGACIEQDACVSAICDAQPGCCATGCIHDPCVEGVKLETSCDACVTNICAMDSYCCTDEWDWQCVEEVAQYCPGSTCNCAPGDTSYDGHCYRYVPYASRDDYWDAYDTCYAMGHNWDLAAIGSAAEDTFVRGLMTNTEAWIGLYWDYGSDDWEWTNSEPVTYSAWSPTAWEWDDCVKTTTSANSWTSDGCNERKAFICEGEGAVLSNPSTAEWDQSCVDMVATVCDATCGDGTGKCVPRGEGEIDTSCLGIDLSVAVPCDNKIPVCNHGTLTAPAGIPIIHYPGNSTHYGTCNPPNTQQDKGVTCATAEEIPPGECIWVTTCGLGDNGIGSNRQIYVNPNALSGYQSNECSCLDNWSESHRGVPCLDPICATAVAETSLKTVNMYLIVDKSTSMGFVGATSNGSCSLSGGTCNCNAGSRWTGARSALTSFFAAPQLDGINVSLEFYPLKTNEAAAGDDGCGRSLYNPLDCESWPCETPLVALDMLTDASSPTDTQEFELVSYMNSVCPIYALGTPTYPALKGTLDAAIAYKNSGHEDEVHVAVLVTDGEPNNCSPDQIDDLAYAAFQNHGIRTYAVGIGTAAGMSFLNDVAADGGTGSATVIDPTDPTTVASSLYNALLGIATNSVSCQFDLPDVSTYDPNNVTVLYLPGNGNNANQNDAVTYNNSTVAGSGCDWYYDNATNPTTITLCDAACNEVRGDPLAQMSVLLGCPPLGPTEGTQVYQGTCPPGTRVQWGYFAYSTATPSDSRVEFSFRTAETEAALAGDFVVAATAQAIPDTQICPMNPVGSGCPIDLYKALDIPAAMMPVLEVKATAYPSTGGYEFPTISDWQITYSCPPSE